jgi:hypothetical protein
MMPIEHEQVCMWTLSADRRSVRMTLPPLPVNGLSEPIAVKIDFGAERGILRDVPRRRRSQSDLLTSWGNPHLGAQRKSCSLSPSLAMSSSMPGFRA